MNERLKNLRNTKVRNFSGRKCPGSVPESVPENGGVCGSVPPKCPKVPRTLQGYSRDTFLQMDTRSPGLGGGLGTKHSVEHCLGHPAPPLSRIPPPVHQKNVGNPNHHYFAKKYRNTPPICIAIRLPFVSQYFRCPYSLRKGEYRQYASHLYRNNASHLYCNTPPICIAILLGKSGWLRSPGCSPVHVGGQSRDDLAV